MTLTDVASCIALAPSATYSFGPGATNSCPQFTGTTQYWNNTGFSVPGALAGASGLSIAMRCRWNSFGSGTGNVPNAAFTSSVGGNTGGFNLFADTSGHLQIRARSQSSDSATTFTGAAAMTAGSFLDVGGYVDFAAKKVNGILAGIPGTPVSATFASGTYNPSSGDGVGAALGNVPSFTGTSILGAIEHCILIRSVLSDPQWKLLAALPYAYEARYSPMIMWALTGPPQTASPAAAAGAWTANTPSLSLAGINLSPGAAQGIWTPNAPAVSPGAVSSNPGSAPAAWSPSSPAANPGGVTASPFAGSAPWTVPNSTATPGAVSSSPGSAAGNWGVTNPTLSPGPVSFSPSAGSGSWSATVPTAAWSVPAAAFAPGAKSIAPAAATATWSVTVPAFNPGAVSLSPGAAPAQWTVPTPTFSITVHFRRTYSGGLSLKVTYSGGLSERKTYTGELS